MIGYTGEVPWHGLGQVATTAAYATADEMERAANLDWQVQIIDTQGVYETDEPVLAEDGSPVLNPDGTPFTEKVKHIIPLHTRSVMRLDNRSILAEGVGRFTPMQNRQLFEIVEAVTGSGEAVFVTAGALGKGELVWAQAEIPGSFYVGGKDEHKRYLFIINSHRQGMSLKLVETDVRVVCQNTANMALNSAAANEIIKVSHMPNIFERAKQAQEKFGLILKQHADTEALYEALVGIQMNQQSLNDFFAAAFPLKGGESEGSEARRKMVLSQRSLAEQLFNQGLGMDIFPGSAYNALNAVTDVVTHYRGRRTAQAHMEHALIGDGATAVANAMAFSRQMLKAGY
jgi:phage/plasmid-like protein (TIGR03299 family)